MKKTYSVILLLVLCCVNKIQAQCLQACGTGANGAYNATVNTTLPGGTYNYTTFTINAGVTVTVTGNAPLIIRATGKVTINGTLDASGGNGTNGVTFSQAGTGGIGVAGGANGGDGIYSTSQGPLDGSSGYGTGGTGTLGTSWSGGGGAGYSVVGTNAGPTVGLGGPAYGTADLAAFDAGSGGGGGSGGYSCGSGGGGAGGGLIQIASCDTITIGAGGFIKVNGGNGGSDGTGNCGGGGGGSGGSLWLSASSIINNGSLQAMGGSGGASNVPGPPYYGVGGAGANGRIRFDYGTLNGTGTVNPAVGYVGSALTVSLTDSNVTCYGMNDGYAVATPLSGTAPYTYTWSNAVTDSLNSNLAPGTYNITVQDNAGCTFNGSVTITQPLQLAATATDSNVSCYGAGDGNITITPTVGFAPFTYLWSNAVTDSTNDNLVPGQYSVIVTDATNCKYYDTFTITQPPAITANVIDSNVTCHGQSTGSIVITPLTGFAPFTYSWSNAVTDSLNAGLSAGQYTVIMTDSTGCQYFDTVTITEPAALNLAMNHTDKTTVANNGTATVTVTGGVGPYTYSWNPGGGNTATISGLDSGWYKVVVTDANGCSDTNTVHVNYSVVGVAQQMLSSGIMVYPNPATDMISLRISLQQPGTIEVVLTDYTGRILEKNNYQVNSGTTTQTLKISQYTNGNYFLKIKAGNTVQNVPVTILR
ncbi:MAG: T9SS type A sorting domain-containing protein [Bacteroidetes bacterium]|nr:T9SS type A sorting domain-containing protein [Bacteroidota bacterium]